jgi:hypothetical protein
MSRPANAGRPDGAFFLSKINRHHPHMRVIHFIFESEKWIARTSRAMTVFGWAE